MLFEAMLLMAKIITGTTRRYKNRKKSTAEVDDHPQASLQTARP